MTKTQLRAYRDIKMELTRLEGIIKTVEKCLFGPRAQQMTGMPRCGSGHSNPTEDAAIKHADLLARYQQKAAELSQALAEIEDAIEILEPRERTLIRLYYADGLTWEDVCVAMSYSWRQVHRIHSKALEKLKEL